MTAPYAAPTNESVASPATVDAGKRVRALVAELREVCIAVASSLDPSEGARPTLTRRQAAALLRAAARR